MKTIFDKYDKEAINGLERALFQGRIEVVQSLYEAERAVKYLLSQPILGCRNSMPTSWASVSARPNG